MTTPNEKQIILEALVVEAAAIALAFVLFSDGSAFSIWATMTMPVSVWIAARAVMAGLEPAASFCFIAGVAVGAEAFVGALVGSAVVDGFDTSWGGLVGVFFLTWKSFASFGTLVALPPVLGFLFSKVVPSES